MTIFYARELIPKANFWPHMILFLAFVWHALQYRGGGRALKIAVAMVLRPGDLVFDASRVTLWTFGDKYFIGLDGFCPHLLTHHVNSLKAEIRIKDLCLAF